MAAGSAYYAFNESGELVRKMPTSGAARSLAQLPDGKFLSAQAGRAGQIAVLRADGSEVHAVVKRGTNSNFLRADATGWTTPTAIAVDVDRKLVFALDTTSAKAGTPDPDWSRVAVFNLDGKFVRDFSRYDGTNMPSTSEQRTWYDGIALDPVRQRVYVSARSAHQIWTFDYLGQERGHAPGANGIAVLPNGNVAVGDPDLQHIRVYDSSLVLVKRLVAPDARDLGVDARGRLYASTADPSLLYLRWPATLDDDPEAVSPRFKKLSVEIPQRDLLAGETLSLPANVIGNPPSVVGAWQTLLRNGDGRNLNWTALPNSYRDGKLSVALPQDARGPYDLLIRYGSGALARSDQNQELYVEKPVNLVSASNTRRVTLSPSTTRRAFVQGESIPLTVEAHLDTAITKLQVRLLRDERALTTFSIPATSSSSWRVPGELTRRLVPGGYALALDEDVDRAAGFAFQIALNQSDSPMQRILYHEFDQTPPTAPQPGLNDRSERLGFLRDHIDALANLGFTRETDRSALKLDGTAAAGVWALGSPLAGTWEPEFYLDRATSRGIRYDSQILSHCSGVRLADSWFAPLNGALQRLTQWFGRYPAFYGFNYNDEAFFSNFPYSDSLPADTAWLDAFASAHPNRPRADAFRAGLERMYAQFDRAVTEIRPDLKRTATPMWQYPAVDGSYAPTVYEHMSESYSHYLSEGYDWPWYAAHSVDMLRRPNLPVMGVFDNGFKSLDGEVYLKNALLVLGRGVQGIGVEHSQPFQDSSAASAFRSVNQLAKMYGSIFAEAEPDNEAAILYSYTQDISEKRDTLGTPHWERVLALHGAGLMANLPMSITYEEDIANGQLLVGGRPRVPLLLLVGQKQALPARVGDGIAAFMHAGGRVATIDESREFAGASHVELSLMEPFDLARKALDGDAIFPLTQPAYERIARALRASFGSTRRSPIDTDDPWTAVHRFNGGAIQYLLLSSETGPYRWDAANVWRLGALYNRSYQPKIVALTFPAAPVVYDVFNAELVAATRSGPQATVRSDLTTFPGRLYALAPRRLDAPRLRVISDGRTLRYSIDVGLRARVPLRIALRNGHDTAFVLYRGTDETGAFAGTTALPPGGGWSLEATELLGGISTHAQLTEGEPLSNLLAHAPDVEIERPAQIRALTLPTVRAVRILPGSPTLVPKDALDALRRPLEARGLQVSVDSNPSAPHSGSCIALGLASNASYGPLITAAKRRGLFEHALGDGYPGPGRGLISAVFAPREYGENCIALVGGDSAGLERAVRRLISSIEDAGSSSSAPRARPETSAVGTPTQSELIRLRDLVGIRLSEIVASHGHIALSASGLLKNIARVDDLGGSARIVTTARIGESPASASLHVSADGRQFGASVRTVQRFAQGFFLGSTNEAGFEGFASFGDPGRLQDTFALSPDGKVVLAPGPYGVVAWRHAGDKWREAWAIDYWKQFDSLDWPVAADAELWPTFDTIIPSAGDVALISFGELPDNGWVNNSDGSQASVSARSLSDGRLRWTFEAPISKTLLFPKLYSNADGSVVLFRVQLGGWSGVSYRYYVLGNGKLLSEWRTERAPKELQVSARGQRIASAYSDRLLEVRLPEGGVAFGEQWHAQPVSLAFSEDGETLFVADDAGQLTSLDAHGGVRWSALVGCNSTLAVDGQRIYAAGWDGRLRAYTTDGAPIWTLDLTSEMASVTQAARSTELHIPARAPTAASTVPTGPNLLRNGSARLTIGGTRGWRSGGLVELSADTLTNGVRNDVTSPWLASSELFWDATAGRQVWAEISFEHPTHVHSLTVYENPAFPDSWPNEALVQIWNDTDARWKTLKHALFLNSAVTTYDIDLSNVKRLRYVPWGDYFRNFHTSEIEVR